MYEVVGEVSLGGHLYLHLHVRLFLFVVFVAALVVVVVYVSFGSSCMCLWLFDWLGMIVISQLHTVKKIRNKSK